MMTRDRGASGTDNLSLGPTGWGRYIDVAFLSVWIVGWLVFEVAGLALLGGVLAGLVGAAVGIALPFASRLAADGSVPLFLLFIAGWLALWTVGGIAALTHLLRSAAGRDVIAVSPDGLEIEWRTGPFRRRRTIAHAAIRRVRLRLHEAMLVVDTAGGTVDVTAFGTRKDRLAALAWLRERLVLPDEAHARRLEAETLPPGWEADASGMETRLTRPTRRTRATQAAVLWVLAGVVSAGFLPALFAASITSAQLVAGALGLLIALWAAWLTWGGTEWLVGHGRLTWRRRSGPWRREQPFDYAAIELLHEVDSDGDDRYILCVRSATALRKIATALHDPAELASLAEWLSARTRFPMKRPHLTSK
jgi:hypothetical protein